MQIKIGVFTLTRSSQDLNSLHFIVHAECTKEADEPVDSKPSGRQNTMANFVDREQYVCSEKIRREDPVLLES